jgi:hypothetical protein
MKSLNRKLLRILIISWLSFGVAGITLFSTLPTPRITVLIERSYCSPEKWQQLVQAYTDLYQKHQNQDIQIQKLVLFSDLDQEVLASPPAPNVLRSTNTYGRSNPQRQSQLSLTYPQSKFLICQTP